MQHILIREIYGEFWKCDFAPDGQVLVILSQDNQKKQDADLLLQAKPRGQTKIRHSKIFTV